MTKHRQQSTEVRAKEIDPMWSQVCSVLHTLGREGSRKSTAAAGYWDGALEAS